MHTDKMPKMRRFNDKRKLNYTGGKRKCQQAMEQDQQDKVQEQEEAQASAQDLTPQDMQTPDQEEDSAEEEAGEEEEAGDGEHQWALNQYQHSQ